MPDNKVSGAPTEVTSSSGAGKQVGSAVIDLTSVPASTPTVIPAFPKAYVAAQQPPASVSWDPSLGVDRPYPRWYINALQKTQGSNAVANVKSATASASAVTPANFPAHYQPPATASQTKPPAVEHPVSPLTTHGQSKPPEAQAGQRPPVAFIMWDASLGLDKVEGPYPQWQVHKPVRWIIDRNPTLVFRSSEEASFTICLRCRCELPDQVARVSINGGAAEIIEFPQTTVFTTVEFPAIFLQGENRVVLAFSAAFEERQGSHRQLVLLVEEVKATVVITAAASEPA